MNTKLLVATLCLVLLQLTGCRKSGSAPAKMEERKKIDACSLLTSEDIQKIQGSPTKENVPSEKAEGGFRISQCYFTAAESNRSVSLTVTQPDADSPNPGSGKEQWKQQFGRFMEPGNGTDKEEATRESAGDKSEEGAPPTPIKGVGDAAFYVGNRVGGTLYVLKGETFLRVSLGGPEENQVKIEKSKALAVKALQRL
jgi:hypothetical protein